MQQLAKTNDYFHQKYLKDRFLETKKQGNKYFHSVDWLAKSWILGHYSQSLIFFFTYELAQ